MIKGLRGLGLVVLCILVVAQFVGTTYAATITVTTATPGIAADGQCSIIEAITNANNDDQSGSTDCAAGAGADVIILTTDITLTAVDNNADFAGSADPDGANGLPLITSEITIQSDGTTRTIARGGSAPAFRLLVVTASGILTIDDLTLQNGLAVDSSPTSASDTEGGAIHNRGTLTVINSTLSGNLADPTGEGGAIHNRNTLTVINSLFSGNSATSLGAAILNNGGSTLTVTNSTFSGNSAPLGSGIYTLSNAVTVNNSIIWGNSGNSIGVFSGSVTVNYSAVDGWPGGGTGNITLGFTAADFFVNPIAPSSAPTTAGDYMLVAFAPAIDAGNDTLVPLGITEDILGNPRIRGASVDMGAYESEDVCTTTFFQEAGGTTHTVPASDTTNFIQAVLCANQLIGEQIILLTESTYTFTEDYVGDSDPETALPAITAGLEISGLGNGSIIERDPGAAEDFRLLLFDMVDTGPDPTGIVANVTVRNGIASVGGAIAAQTDGSVSVFNATLENNTSTGAGGAVHSTGPRIDANNTVFNNNTAGTSGGALFSPTSMSIANSTFTGNAAQNGVGGAVVAQGNLRLINSTVTNNSAPNGDGGAVHTSGNVLLAASTVSGNSSGGLGGGIYTTGRIQSLNSIVNNNSGVDGGGIYSNSNDESRVFNSLFHDNTATNDGGALFINSSTAPVIRNNTFTQNIADADNDSNGLGGGIFYDSGAIISNNILWQNTLGNGTIDDFEGSLTFPTSIVSELGGANPNFTDPANDDFSLQATSLAAIDQGDDALYNSSAPSEFDLSVDIDGDGVETGPIDSDVALTPRFFNGGTIDLGAYEFQDTSAYTVEITATDATASENPIENGQFTVTLTPTNATGSPLDITYTVSGTATAGDDYTTLSGTVSIADGADNATIDLVPIEDTIDDDAETVIVTLDAPSQAFVSLGTNSEATVTINDDDTADVIVDDTALTVAEPNTSATFAITLAATPDDGTALVLTIDGDGDPENGMEFLLTNAGDLIPLADVEGLQLLDDPLLLDTETDADGDTSDPDDALTDADSGTSDPDDAPTDADGDTSDPDDVSEPQAPTTVTLDVTSDDTTACSLVPSGSVTISPGASTSFTVTAVNDAIDNVGDQRTCTIVTGDPSSADPAYDALTAADVADVAVTVTDDDDAGVALSASDLVMTPTDTRVYRVTLLSQLISDVTVEIAVTNVCAVSRNTLTFTPANWDVPQPVSVTASAAGNCRIDHTLNTTAPAYDGLAVASIPVRVLQPGDDGDQPLPGQATVEIRWEFVGDVAVGQRVIVRYTISNNTGTDVINPVFTLAPPADLTVTSATPSAGTATTAVRWSDGILPANGRVVLDVAVVIDATFSGNLIELPYAFAGDNVTSQNGITPILLVDALPTTGETPWWRNIVVGLGVLISVMLVRVTMRKRLS